MATSYTVLVVDQADVVRRITNRTLSERGYRVLEAANAVEALAVLAMPEMHIDLVLIGAAGSLEHGQLRLGGPNSPPPAGRNEAVLLSAPPR